MRRVAKTVTRIKDLPPTQGLRGVRFRFPGDGKPYYFWSSWEKGVWAKKSLSSEQVFPLFCQDVQEALHWEVLSNAGNQQ